MRQHTSVSTFKAWFYVHFVQSCSWHCSLPILYTYINFLVVEMLQCLDKLKSILFTICIVNVSQKTFIRVRHSVALLYSS